MAKKSSIVKNERKRLLAEKFEPLRKELRKKQSNLKLSPEERFKASLRLQKLPKMASRCRVVNRCQITGRSRGNLRRFGLSRLMFRKMAHEGLIPGVIKSSW
ncbi:MAG: 30S ribosomal protein S14 [Bdellovibrionales bacterium]|nr:30S ribosomal protein S14 [Bdellovibrionales bacterium]